jgi:hypothetical protein
MKQRYYLFTGWRDPVLGRTVDENDPKYNDYFRHYEWFIDGIWQKNEELSLALEDARHDYGDYSIGDQRRITEEQANDFIKEMRNS